MSQLMSNFALCLDIQGCGKDTCYKQNKQPYLRVFRPGAWENLIEQI